MAVAFRVRAARGRSCGTDRALDRAGRRTSERDGPFVRRQRRDARAASRVVSPRCSDRGVGTPAVGTLSAALLLAPVLLLPNPQRHRDRPAATEEAAERQAERIDRVEDLESKGQDANDPRTQLAEELTGAGASVARATRRARRQHLAIWIDRGQRPGADRSGTSSERVAGHLSRARSVRRRGHRGEQTSGPGRAKEDLAELGDKLDELTPAEHRELARELAELEATASQADGAAGTALSDAAQSLAQGGHRGARSALDRPASRHRSRPAGDDDT